MSGNISFALNANNDLYLDAQGNLATVTGVDAVAQDCKCAMSAQYGEMIFQPLDGLPNLSDVWLQQNLIKWEAAARKTLSSVPGVVMVQTFTYTVAGGVLSYVAAIKTIYSASLIKITGNISIQGTLA